MGAKIILSFLSDKCKKDILEKVFSVLQNAGWEYNKYILGEYTYWLDSPIWEFGNSVTKKEVSINNTDKRQSIDKIIKLLSQYYSPTITVGIKICDQIFCGRLTIFEGEKNWVNISFSVDREKLIDSPNKSIKSEGIKLLKATFTECCLKLEPFYAIGATEFNGVVASPERISQDLMLGDLNYFSSLAMQKIQLKIEETNYEIIDNDIGKLYILKNNIFEY